MPPHGEIHRRQMRILNTHKAHDSEGEEGFYGLVRNHHYNITLKSITGIGFRHCRPVTSRDRPAGIDSIRLLPNRFLYHCKRMDRG